VQLDVDWITTGDVIMGRLISIMSLGYIIVLFLVERKLAPRTGPKPGVGDEPRVS
jgi:hypothetical protein